MGEVVSRSVELLPLEALVPSADNARTHSAAQVEQLRKSLRQFGAVAPILVDGDNHVIAGHGRLMAAAAEGWETFPCLRIEHLTPEQLRAYMLADNRLAELAGWDMELVASELHALEAVGFDISVIGFDRDMINLSGEDDVQEDAGPGQAPEQPLTQPGDIWLLGEHRLLCGDATDPAAVARLMDGEAATLVVTDPPYGMDYRGGGGQRRDGIMGDAMGEDEFSAFLAAAYGAMAGVMGEGASLYAFYLERGSGAFLRALAAAGLTYRQNLVWVKNQPTLGGSRYQHQHEDVVFATKGKGPAVWNGGRVQRDVLDQVDLMNEDELRRTVKLLLDDGCSDVLREDKPQRNELHPTMKPVRLLGRLIRNSSHRGDIVLDPFGGSGSTLMACQQLGRRCRMMEADPRYCDVIVARWEAATGQEAVRT